ncbi:MAG: calcium/sodium antiporter [Bacteroidota bacterium]
MAYVWLIAGLITLLVSGELLVKGAVSIALKLRISTLVVGMTIVSFGTSAPELLVSVKAALSGHPEISIGNVIGSNIANLALVLGITAIIFPILVDNNSIRIDWPMMMASTVVFYLFILDGVLVWWEGAILLGSLVAFGTWLIRKSRKSGAEDGEVDEDEDVAPLWKDILFITLACVGLVFGVEWLLDAAVEIARAFEVSEHVIAVTIIAFGTSVPELITSGVAAFRKQTDISIGNLIGSNIFNILGILGVTAMVREIPVLDTVIQADMWWVLGIAALILPLMLFQRKIGWWKGVLLLIIYAVYIIGLVQGVIS